jgi:hypothetical protein
MFNSAIIFIGSDNNVQMSTISGQQLEKSHGHY